MKRLLKKRFGSNIGQRSEDVALYPKNCRRNDQGPSVLNFRRRLFPLRTGKNFCSSFTKKQVGYRSTSIRKRSC